MPKTKDDSSLVRAVQSAPYPLSSLLTRIPITDQDLKTQGQGITTSSKSTKADRLDSSTTKSLKTLPTHNSPNIIPIENGSQQSAISIMDRSNSLASAKRPKVGRFLSGADEMEMMSDLECGISRLSTTSSPREEDQTTPKAGRFPANLSYTPHKRSPSSIKREAVTNGPMNAPNRHAPQFLAQLAARSSPQHSWKAVQSLSRPMYPTPSTTGSRSRIPAGIVEESETSTSGGEGYGSTDGEADEETIVSRRTPKRSHFPSVTGKNRHRRAKTKIPNRPLFIGQTNLSPFTFFPDSKDLPAATLSAPNGYASDATSVQTVRPRKKGTFRDKPIAKRLAFRAPLRQANHPSRTGIPFKLVADHTTTPWRPNVKTQPRDAPRHQYQLTEAPPQYVQLPSQPLRLQDTLLLPSAQPKRYSFSDPPIPDSPCPSPVPMSVDPRSSAEGHRASWPHPLDPREVFRPQTGFGTGSTSLMSICQEPAYHETSGLGQGGFQAGAISGYGHVGAPGAFSHQWQQREPPSFNPPPPVWSTGLGTTTIPSTTVANHTKTSLISMSRPTREMPIAKACHNFLVARRIQAAKRRKLAQEYQRRVAKMQKAKEIAGQQAVLGSSSFSGQLDARTGNAGTHDSNPSLRQVSDAVGVRYLAGDTDLVTRHRFPIRAISSIARVDESKPPRKRRRSLSPSSAFDEHQWVSSRGTFTSPLSAPKSLATTHWTQSTHISAGQSKRGGIRMSPPVVTKPLNLLPPAIISSPAHRSTIATLGEDEQSRRHRWINGERRRPETQELGSSLGRDRLIGGRNNIVTSSPAKQSGNVNDGVKGISRAGRRREAPSPHREVKREASVEAGLGGFGFASTRGFLESRLSKAREKPRSGSVARW